MMVFSVIALGFWDKKNTSAQCNIITSGILHNRTLAFTYDFCPYWIMCIFITKFYSKLCDKNKPVIHSEKNCMSYHVIGSDNGIKNNQLLPSYSSIHDVTSID